jgi:chromosome segregation ATPase
MDGILGKIKEAGRDALGTFVVLDDGTTVAADSPQARAAASPQPVGAPTGTVAPPAATGVVAPDPEFVEQLVSAVNGSSKTAYAQFQALYEAMSMLTDERARVQAALTATQTAHKLTAADIATAIDDRLRILAEERASFERAAKAEAEQAVGGTLKDAEKARAEIARKQEEIRTLEAKAAELEKQAADARASIDAGSTRFAVSYAVVEAQLNAERSRIAPFATPSPKQ